MDALIEIFSYRPQFVGDMLRWLFLWLDGMIYGLIQPVYSIAIKLSNLRNFFTSEDIASTTAKNIYVFLGLFMLFKLAFSIISMIANPDAASDKQKGLGKVFSNAVIMIILVVIMPTIFNLAYGVQDVLINQGVLSGIFANIGEDKEGLTGNEGQLISNNVFKIFVGKNPAISHEVDSVNNALNNIDKLGIAALHDEDAIKNHSGSQYRIYYMMLLSTIVGGMMLWSFIKMCVEIALRSIKLIVLEVISPIAIISYLDPQSASKGVFSKWMNMAIKTYLSLFIRLGILYFVAALLANIDYSQFGSLAESGFGVFESLFVILAVITFMQIAPKFLEELFGYKAGEDGKAIKGIVGGALGLGIGAAAGTLGVGKQIVGAGYNKVFGDKPPGAIRRGAKKVLGGASDIYKAGKAGAESAKKGGPLAALHTPKDLNYKKAQEAKKKAQLEESQKSREANAYIRQGEKASKIQNEYTNNDAQIASYANNPNNFSKDKDANSDLYKTIYDPVRKAEFAKAIAKEKQKNKFNSATFSEPIAQRKNTINEAKVRLQTYEKEKAYKQFDFDRILKGEVVQENGVTITKEMAIERLININTNITATSNMIEKNKGELETLFKDPNYSADAKMEAGMKQYAASSVETDKKRSS